MNTRDALALPLTLLLSFGVSISSEAAPPEVPTFLLPARSPSKLVLLPGGSLLLGARGVSANTAKVLFADQVGDSSTFLTGLPSMGEAGFPVGDANGDGRVDLFDIFYIVNHLFSGGPAPVAPPTEPDGLAARGSTLFIATGEIVPSGEKPSAARNAVLAATFSAGLGLHGPFVLPASDYASLLQGNTVVLTQPTGETASVALLVNGAPAISDLIVDETTGRLYIVSRADGTVSWVPLP